MAVLVLSATVTFGASLSTLVSNPPLYGWNWDYTLAPAAGTSLPKWGLSSIRIHLVTAW